MSAKPRKHMPIWSQWVCNHVFNWYCTLLNNPLTVLHPSCKLKWFGDHGYESNYIAHVQSVLEKAYECLATSQEAENPTTTTEISALHLDPACPTNFEYFQVSSPIRGTTDDVCCYLSTPVERCSDPIKWWYNWRDEFPVLSRLVQDYLSIPGT